MTTHPPGQPPGPTHPPKTTAFPVVSTAHAELDYEEPSDYGVEPLPRLGEVIRDAERLLAQALAVVRRPVDPLSMDSRARAQFWLDSSRSHIQAALSDLAKIGDEPLPPTGSAVKVPNAKPTSPDPSPASAAPVSLPGRGVGPGVLGAACEECADIWCVGT